MKNIVIILNILVLIVGGCRQSLYAQFKIPTGFSELKNSPANGQSMKRICTDFDGDGKKDTATIIEKNDSELQCYFLIYLTGSNKNYIIKMFERNNDFVYPIQLSVKKNVIQFAYFGEGTSVFFRGLKLRYNYTKQKIQLIGYDSGYKIYYGGSCTKSYNLLTGDYIVTNWFYEYINSKEVKRKIVNKGNKKMNDIFVENINNELLEQLDLAGNEFELE